MGGGSREHSGAPQLHVVHTVCLKPNLLTPESPSRTDKKSIETLHQKVHRLLETTSPTNSMCTDTDHGGLPLRPLLYPQGPLDSPRRGREVTPRLPLEYWGRESGTERSRSGQLPVSVSVFPETPRDRTSLLRVT